MKPILLQKPEILLVGMSFYGDPFDTNDPWSEENHIGRTCRRFQQYLETHGQEIRHRRVVDVMYEVHVYDDATTTQGLFEVFVGLPVERLEALPVALSAKVLPATQYAVFTLEGEAILSDWYMHIDQWLETAGYERCHPYSVQYYDTRFKGMDQIAESVLDVYMPVRIAGNS
ncbi:MAG: GyrI-like domain-containing protein [Chloroflexota bacterium]